MPKDSARDRARRLIDEHGTTFASAAGITLRDQPAPLFQLLVLVTTLSKPIDADMATAAARELIKAGYRTPRKMLAATWQQRVDALVRAHYRRFDESTATRLEESATWLLDTYRGDLRRLATAGDCEVKQVWDLLQEAPGVGPTGAGIFLREAQAVWAWARPYADDRVRQAARKHRLPSTPERLAEVAGTDNLSRIGAALIRAGS